MFNQLLFSYLHKNFLVYNTSWEDPKIDRQLLGINDQSKLLMITGAGDNCLDYLLDHPASIETVDLNYRQNALLQLKLHLFDLGDYEVLDKLFRKGIVSSYHKHAFEAVLAKLTDRDERFISELIYKKPDVSLYKKGTTGLASRAINHYLNSSNLDSLVHELFESSDLEEQKEIYSKLDERLWNQKFIKTFNSGWPTLFLGIPNHQFDGAKEEKSILRFLKNALKTVFTNTLACDNYFWQLYFNHAYSTSCKPNYLMDENFEIIKNQVQKISAYTGSLLDHLKSAKKSYSHIVLLDHMDWITSYQQLQELWNQIIDHAESGTKVLFRSVHNHRDFLPDFVDQYFHFDEMPEQLHQFDRVGTYGSTHLAIRK